MGRITRATDANKGILFYRLTPEKTTWQKNYVEKYTLTVAFMRSPLFSGSSVIKEKPIGTTRPLMPCEVAVLEEYM